MEKQYIIRNANELVYEDRMAVLVLLMKNNVKICEHRDGSRVRLDLLDDKLIREIFNMVQKGLEVSEINRIY